MVIKTKGNNMSKCLDCKWFDPQCNECNQDNHCPCVYRDDEACDKFEQRKECKHRYENCDMNGCSIICHSFPSEKGCGFIYRCNEDDYLCDEKCELHRTRHQIKSLEDERKNLYIAKSAINLALARYSDEITKLIEKLKKLDS